MNKTTHKLLRHLAKQINRPNQPPESESLSLTPKRFDYYFNLPMKERLGVHEELQALFDQSSSAKLIYSPSGFGEVERIDSVEITDPYEFLKLSSESCLYELVESACNALSKLSVSYEWLQSIVDKSIIDWRRGVQAFGVKPRDVTRLIDSIQLLDWVEGNNRVALPDIRTLSVKLFHDSKRVESITGTIARIYESQLPEHLQGSSADEVMDYIGLSKFAPMIRLKGDFDIILQEGRINCADIIPYLGLPPDVIKDIQTKSSPAYLLFIENATTFNRYTREIQDNGWVVYTNGFPSRSWTPVFRSLANQAGVTTPIFHWGDVDIGGYRILMHMQAILNIDIKPFRMLPEVGQGTGSKSISIRSLRSTLHGTESESIKELAMLLEKLEEKSDFVPWVEQEQLDLKSPVE